MSAKRDKAEATRLHSLIVRSRGFCENCGRCDNLQCAHIISRRYSRTRVRLDNAFCLDAKCHMRFTEWPLEFAAFVIEKIGREKYEELHWLSIEGPAVDWAFERETLARIWELTPA